MKTLLMALTMVISASALAGGNSNPNLNAKCDSYFAAVAKESPAKIRLDLGLKAMAVAAMVELTRAQEAKIFSNTVKFIAENPDKEYDFEKMFHFICMEELDGDSVNMLKEQLNQLEELEF